MKKIMVGIALMALCSCDEDKPLHKWPVYNSELDGSVSQVKDYLKKNLNDPSSYDGVEWYRLSVDDTIHPHNYLVRHKYRAKNIAGGVMLFDQVFYLDSVGNVTGTKDF